MINHVEAAEHNEQRGLKSKVDQEQAQWIMGREKLDELHSLAQQHVGNDEQQQALASRTSQLLGAGEDVLLIPSIAATESTNAYCIKNIIPGMMMIIPIWMLSWAIR